MRWFKRTWSLNFVWNEAIESSTPDSMARFRYWLLWKGRRRISVISGLAKMLSFQLIKKLHRSYYILLYKIWKNIYPRERLTRFEKKAFFLTWNIKEILNHWIIESCRSFYLFIYLFSFWENNFSFPIHKQIVSKLRYKRTITQIRTSNLNHRSRIGNRSKLPSKKKKVNDGKHGTVFGVDFSRGEGRGKNRRRNRLLEAIAGSQKGAVIWTAAAQGQGLNLAGISSPRR